jgi:hypothetical protein
MALAAAKPTHDSTPRYAKSLLRCGISAPPMSARGQKFALPQCNIRGRFTSISRLYGTRTKLTEAVALLEKWTARIKAAAVM